MKMAMVAIFVLGLMLSHASRLPLKEGRQNPPTALLQFLVARVATVLQILSENWKRWGQKYLQATFPALFWITFGFVTGEEKIPSCCQYDAYNSFTGHDVKMSGQKCFERCQSNAHLPQCYQSIQEILYLDCFVAGRAAGGKKWKFWKLFMGPFIISKTNLHVLRVPSLSSVQDTI